MPLEIIQTSGKYIQREKMKQSPQYDTDAPGETLFTKQRIRQGSKS